MRDGRAPGRRPARHRWRATCSPPAPVSWRSVCSPPPWCGPARAAASSSAGTARRAGPACSRPPRACPRPAPRSPSPRRHGVGGARGGGRRHLSGRRRPRFVEFLVAPAVEVSRCAAGDIVTAAEVGTLDGQPYWRLRPRGRPPGRAGRRASRTPLCTPLPGWTTLEAGAGQARAHGQPGHRVGRAAIGGRPYAAHWAWRAVPPERRRIPERQTWGNWVSWSRSRVARPWK